MSSVHELLTEAYQCFQNKNYPDALFKAQLILKKKFNIDALVLCGISSFSIEQYSDAEYYLKLAFKERPLDKNIQMHLLETFNQTNQVNKGLNLISTIKEIDCDIKKFKIKFLQIKGDYASVIKVAKTMHESIFTCETLAWNYELINKLKNAKKYCNKGLNIDRHNFKCNIIKAKLKLREEKLNKAINSIKQICIEKLSLQNKSIYYSVKAQIKEKQKKHHRAFKLYGKSNSQLKQTHLFHNLTGHSYYTSPMVKHLISYYKSSPQFTNLIPAESNITFMLGLPRSGTTLLENILNSHTGIQTIEEKPTIDDLLNHTLEFTKTTNTITNVSDEKIKQIQEQYIKIRAKYSSGETIIIDKMPLNIIHIGLLYRIFPNARFIISTRDIRDVALSCYFQNFKLNDAMVNFLDWEQTKHYLYSIKTLGDICIKNYPLRKIIVPYEKLVSEPFEQIKLILKFLGLKWQADILDYRKDVKGKNIITPSYSSVSKKINRSSLNRWENYKSFVNFNDNIQH